MIIRFIPALEGLRGYAATMVVAVHCIAVWKPEGQFIKDVLYTAITGRAPVILFFVLSAFVLTPSLVHGRYALDFAARRLFRLYPAAVAVACVVAAFSPNSLEELISAATYFDNRLIAPYWTLRVELIGSAMLPVIVMVMLRNMTVALLIIALTALLPFLPYTPFGIMVNATLFCFPLGAWLAIYLHRLALLREYPITVGTAGAIFLIFSHCLVGRTPEFAFSGLSEWLGSTDWLTPTLGERSNISLYLQHVCEAVGSCMLIGTVACKISTWPILENRVSQFLGQHSYPLYLVHYPILYALLPKFSGSTPEFLIALFATVMALSLGASVLLRRWVELPAIAVGRMIAERLQKKVPASGPSS